MPIVCPKCGTTLILNEWHTRAFCQTCGNVFGTDGQVISTTTVQNTVSVQMDIGVVKEGTNVVGLQLGHL